ncbi:MAG: aminoacetone oxidase family FAD-binding enzyme [bacterium]
MVIYIKDVIIIGAGPAGMMCANVLENNYLILEKNSTAGKKLLLTGGSRCNLTSNLAPGEFLEKITHNKKYLYSTINLFGPREIMGFFSKIGLKEEENRKIFPKSNNSNDVLNELLKKIQNNILYNQSVVNVEKIEDYFKIETINNTYYSKKVVITCGGASFPQTGSTGDIKTIITKLHHDIVDFFPCETGIKIENKNIKKGLSITNAKVKYGKKTCEGPLMFTSSGLSGEVIMNISGEIYQKNIKKIYVDYLSSLSVEEIRNLVSSNQDKEVSGLFKGYLSKNMIDFLFIKEEFFHKKISKYSDKEISKMIMIIKEYEFDIKEVNDVKIAYVTGGGIDLKNVNTKTFESKIISGLYFAGECLDLHGPIGGFNITIALSTGYSVGYYLNDLK